VLVVVPAMRRVPVPVVQVVQVIVVRNRAVAAAVAVHVVVLARFVVPMRGVSDHVVASPVGWVRGRNGWPVGEARGKSWERMEPESAVPDKKYGPDKASGPTGPR
jgi:hypothetical protein